MVKTFFIFFYTNCQNCLQEKDRNIHLNDRFSHKKFPPKAQSREWDSQIANFVHALSYPFPFLYIFNSRLLKRSTPKCRLCRPTRPSWPSWNVWPSTRRWSSSATSSRILRGRAPSLARCCNQLWKFGWQKTSESKIYVI